MGKDTIPVNPPDEYPWMAALMDQYGHFCGGSLIHNRHILTAARCVLNKTSTFPPKRELYVRLGEYDFLDKTRNKQNFSVERIIIHEDYKWPSNANDIAILRLTHEVDANNFEKIDLPLENEIHVLNKTGKIIG